MNEEKDLPERETRKSSPPPWEGAGGGCRGDDIHLPQSLVALPPSPTTISWAPRRKASAINWPVPYDEARRGLRSSGFNRPRPLACAISMKARPSLSRYWACIGRIRGSRTRTVIRSKLPVASTASRNPSPPSLMGRHTTSASGQRRSTASRAASLAWREVKQPFSESIAIMTFIATKIRNNFHNDKSRPL